MIKKNEIGVYLITFNGTNKQYVGSTFKCLKDRFSSHKMHLRNKTHPNNFLQNLFNKYGEENIKFDILEICEKDKCREREQYYINTLPFLVNIEKIVGLCTAGIPRSEETKKKISAALKGRKHTQARIDNIKEAVKGRKKPPKERTKHKNLYEIKCLNTDQIFYGYKAIADFTNYCSTYIARLFQHEDEIRINEFTFKKINNRRKIGKTYQYLEVATGTVFKGRKEIKDKIGKSWKIVDSAINQKIYVRLDREESEKDS